jgi:glycerol-3-phosphate O-acyltransferase
LSIKKPFKDIIKPFEVEAPGNKYWKIMEGFLDNFEKIISEKGLDKEFYETHLTDYARQVLRQIKSPYEFEAYHEALRAPFDHFALGLTLFRPLIDFPRSKLFGKENLDAIVSILEKKENVIIFANHQTEADPQAINLLLEKQFPSLSEKIAYVAGERVVTDALAVPFSLGINLFCVYSKKYFDVYPDRKTKMLEHNKQTMLRLGQHLDEGGKCIMIFPSGGRDRPDENKIVRVANFDQQSIELMYLLGRKAKSLTHYFPLALSTHDMLPPPEDLQIDLGEKRSTNEAAIYLDFGKEIDMENFPNSDTTDKAERKSFRAQYIYGLVSDMYRNFPG